MSDGSEGPTPEVGARARLKTGIGSIEFTEGDTYVIAEVDHSDDTLKLRSDSGSISGWIPWDKVETGDGSHDWILERLSPAGKKVVQSTKGSLTLRPEVVVAVWDALPEETKLAGLFGKD